jgi:UDP-2-acetamido-3-amino-2,3-dideoxy-glucuronate N-acetyltransferase
MVVPVCIHPSADVAHDVVLGDGTAVWHLAQLRERAVLGQDYTVSRGAYIGVGERLGDRCKVQNGAHRSDDWTPAGVTCLAGASIRAGAICVAPVTVGRWAMVAAGGRS